MADFAASRNGKRAQGERRVAMQEGAAENRGDFRLARQHYVRAVDVTLHVRKLMDKLDQMANVCCRTV